MGILNSKMLLLIATAMGGENFFGVTNIPKETNEEQKEKLAKANEALKLKQGLIKFVYNGQIIWARDKKNFERKIRNLNKNK